MNTRSDISVWTPISNVRTEMTGDLSPTATSSEMALCSSGLGSSRKHVPTAQRSLSFLPDPSHRG
jgi:hypothetical protein